MAAPRPTDEQELALGLRAPYVLVSASAGTGKTKTLVEKVVRSLQAGIPLDRILVITFTQKASEELRARLHQAFEETPSLRPQRLLLPQAHISTIDSFGSRLLRENAAAAGVDPAFRVLANPEDELIRAEIIDELFHRWYRGSEPSDERDGFPARGGRAHLEFLRLVELCDYRGGKEALKLEVGYLLRLARAHPDPDAFVASLEAGLEARNPPYLGALALVLRRTGRSATDAYATMLRVAAEEFAGRDFAAHEAFLATLRQAPWPADDPALAAELPDALRRLQSHFAPADADGRWGIQIPRLPSGTKDRLGAWNELVKSLLGPRKKYGPNGPFQWLPRSLPDLVESYARTRPTLQALIAVLRQAMAAYEHRKREQGRLDFADLELYTRRLLADPPAVLRDRFDLVFVDEYQDVNRLQSDIVRLLYPREGRFLVGDVKQCIYQFRLSDPTIFRGLCAGVPALKPGAKDRDTAHDAEHVRVFLSRNFRSHAGLLDEANRIFGTLLREEMIGGRYEDEALHAGRVDPTDPGPASPEPQVEFHFIEKPGPGEETALPAFEAEARLVARRMKALVARGVPVLDQERETWRPVGFGDMAVLLRSPGPTGPRFARLLREQGVPIIFGGQDFFEREETRDFLNLLRVIDNAHDDLALAALLRAPMCGFTDADLARLRVAWPASFSLLAALRMSATGEADEWSGPPGDREILGPSGGEPLSPRCAAFLEALTRWRERAQASDLPGAIGAALEESGLLEAAAAPEDGTARVGNLEQLLALVREHCRERDHSLPGLIRFLSSAESAGGTLESVSSDAGDSAAARMLSLHKAKGLEFPVVVLALTGRGFNLRDSAGKVLSGEDWLGVDLFDPQQYLKTPTVARQLLAHLRQRRTLEEEMRLLYVAFTRARDRLIVTGVLGASWESRIRKLALWDERGEIPDLALYGARSPMTWLLGVLQRGGLLAGLTAPDTEVMPRPSLRLARHTVGAILGEAPAAASPLADARATSVRGDEALPALVSRLRARYPHEAATRWRGKYWATEIKRRVDLALHDEEREAGAELPHARPEPPAPDAMSEGLWLHAVLEELDLTATRDVGALIDHARRMAERGRIPAAWVTEGNLSPIARFLGTPLAAEMREAGTELEREVLFALKLRPSELAAIWPDIRELPDEEWVLVQGQIDALWPRPDGTRVLLDFKSDRLTGDDQIAARATSYRPQLWIYREAVARLWKPGRVESIIYFLRPARAVPLD